MSNDLIKILEYGCKAPSGSNSQPWSFKVRDNIVEIIAHPEKDHPILNFQNRGTYIAHGALIENIEIASRYFGYKPEIELFPYKDNLNISARIIFNKTTPQPQELFEAIEKRCTNRKPYYSERLKDQEIEFLLKEKDRYKNIKVNLFVEKDLIEKISKYLANDMVIYLNNKLLHELLFKEIIWEDKDYKKEGLYIKTLELKKPQITIFKLLKNWKIDRFFLKLGIDKKIAEENKKLYSTSPLFVSFSIYENFNKELFVNLGRLIENIWLRATKLNLSVQIITGILFLYQQLQYGRNDIFSENEKSIILESYNSISDLLKLDKKELIIAFLRIGKSDPPTSFSFKKEPILIQEND